MGVAMRFYAYGIFVGWPHPCPKTPEAKHNPLQRLTYLALAAILLPFMMVTGLLYYLYNDWASLGLGGLRLPVVSLLHLAGAFAVLVFLVVHVYMSLSKVVLPQPLGPSRQTSSPGRTANDTRDRTGLRS